MLTLEGWEALLSIVIYLRSPTEQQARAAMKNARHTS